MVAGKNRRTVVLATGGLLRSLRLGVSVTGLMLAGAAMTPALAQVNKLNGATLSGANARNALGGFSAVTNGTLNLTPLAGGLGYSGGFNDSLGAFSLSKLGNNPLTLSGANLASHSGDTTVSGGSLIAGAANVLSPNSRLVINAGRLVLNGFSQQVNGLSGNGPVVNTVGPATLTISGAGTRSYNGTIGGQTAIVKAGTGSQSLGGINSYTGGTTLAAGTLRYVTGSALGTGALTVTGASILTPALGGLDLGNAIILNADLEFAGTSTTWSGVISGGAANSITKTTFGDLNLANANNSFAGGVVLGRGQINVGGNDGLGTSRALGTGALTAGAAQVTLGTIGGAAATLANNVSVGNILNFELPDAGNALTLAGTVSGPGVLYLKSGAGALVLSGNNNYASTAVASGVLGFGSNTGAGAGVISTGGTAGLAAYADGLTVANAIRTDTNLRIDTRGFGLTLGGVIANNGGAGGIEKIGAGALTLTAAQSYTGATTVTAGTLVVNGSLVTSGTTVASGATLAGAQSLPGTGSLANTTTITSGGMVSPGGTGFGTLTFGSLDLQTGSVFNLDLSIPGVLGGAGNDAIIVSDTFVVGDGAILSVNFAGAITPGLYPFLSGGNAANVLGGGFTLGAAPSGFSYSVEYGLTTALLVSIDGVRYWDGSGPFGNGTVNGGTGTWNAAATNWTDLGGNAELAWGSAEGFFAGTAGTVTVADTQTYTTLHFTTAGYVLNGGTLTAAGGTLDIDNAGTTTINSAITGSGGLTKTGAGELVLGGANGFTGAYTAGAGTGVTTVDSDTALGATAASFGAGTTLRTLGNQTLTVPIAIDGGVTFAPNGALLTLNGVISGTSGLSIVDTAPAFGVGVVLGGPNTYTGTTTVNGSAVFVAADTGLGNVANAIALNNGVLSATDTFTTARNIALGGGFGGIFVDAGDTLTSNGVISGGSAANFVKGNPGTLILGPGSNSFTGGIVLQGGTLQVSNPASLGAGSFILFATDSTLRLAAPVTLSRAVSINTGATATIDTAGNDSTLGGVVVNNPLVTTPFDPLAPGGALTKIGAGQLTLTQPSNLFTGPTNLNQGSLRIAGGNSAGFGVLNTMGGTTLVAGIGTNQAFTMNGPNGIMLGAGNTTLDLVGGSFAINTTSGVVATNGTALTINRAIGGMGGIVTANAGILNLNGVNSYSGGTTLANVAAFVGNTNALGTGGVTLNNLSAVQNNSGNALTLANGIALAGAASPAVSSIAIGGANDLTLTGALSGAGGLNKVGAGTLTVANAANTASGMLQVNQGTLNVTGALTAAAATVNVASGATLAGTGSIAGTVNVAGAGILSAGVGAVPGVLTIGALALSNTSDVRFDLGAANTIAGPLNDQVVVGGLLTLDGRLTVTQAAGGTFGLGLYNLFTYGSLADNTLEIAALAGGLGGIIQNNSAQRQINLVVASPGTSFLFWDGADTGTTPGVQGGTNSWTAAGFNWTGAAPSALNTTWVDGSVGVFGGVAGTVTLAQSYSAQGLQFQTSGYVLTAGELSIPASTGTFVITDPGVAATINSPLSGTGRLAKQGTGTLVLGGNSSYSGGTTLTAGILAVSTATALGSGALAMATGTTLRSAAAGLSLANAIDITGTGTVGTNGNVFTLGGIVSGGALTKAGAGTLTLAGTNTYTGGTTVTAGTVAVGNDAALGTGVVTLQAGTILQRVGAGPRSVFNGVVLAGSSTVDTNGGEIFLNAPISGAGPLNIVNSAGTGFAGLAALGNVNSYTGGTIVDGARVFVTADSGLGAAAGRLTLRSGQLSTNASFATARDVLLDGGFGSVRVEANSTLTITGTVSGAELRQVGDGTLALGAANDYTGGTTLTAGTIAVGNNAALGTGALAMASGTTLQSGTPGRSVGNDIGITGTGNVDSNGSMLTLGGVISGGTLNKIGAGTLVLDGNNSYAGGTRLGGGVVSVGSDANLGAAGGSVTFVADSALRFTNDTNIVSARNVALASNGTIDTTQATQVRLNGVVSGTGLLTKRGLGVLALAGSNDYSGGTRVEQGFVRLLDNAALGTGTATVVGATVDFGANLTVANNFVISGGAAFRPLPNTASTLTGTISGDGGLTVGNAGTGEVTFANPGNSYAGGTTINSGATLAIASDGALGATSGGLTFDLEGGALRTTADVTSARTVAIAGGAVGTFGIIANTTVLSGVISGDGGVAKRGSGILNLTGANTYTGATSVIVGDLRVGGSLANTAVTVASGATLSGTGTIAGAVTILDGGNLTPGTSVGTLTVGALTLNNSSNVNFEFGAANSIGGAFNDLVIVNGNLVLDGLLNVTQSAGGNFTTGIYEIFQYTGTLTDNTLSFGAALPNGRTGLIQATVPGQVNLIVTQSPSIVLNWDGADGVGNGVISGGSGVWNAANTNWTGAPPSALNTSWQSTIGVFQTVGGTVSVEGSQAFEMLQFATNGYVLNSGSGGGLATPGAGVLFAATGVAATINAPISGAGSIVKQGGGTIVLGGNRSLYSGGTDIQTGTLAVTANGALGGGMVTIRGNATLAAAANNVTTGNAVVTTGNGIVDAGGAGNVYTLAGNITGAGSISQVGLGNLVLGGANGFTNLGINAGTVTLGSNTAAGIGSIALNDNATLAAGANNLVVGNVVVTTGNGLVSTNGNSFTLAGNIAGAGSISNVGGGNLILGGNNSFTNLGINTGTVTLGTNSAAGIGGIALNSDATLAAGASGLVIGNTIVTTGNGLINTNGNNFTFAGNIAGAGSISNVGGGNLILGGNNSFSNLGINTGTVTLGTNTAAGIGGIALNNDATLAAGANGLIIANTVVTTANGLVNTNGNTFTLAGNVAGAGSISNVGGGNLILGGNNSFSNLGINTGTVTLGTNTAAGIGSIALNNNATLAAGANGLVIRNIVVTTDNGLINTNGNSFTLAGDVAGPGSISNVGGGNLILNGNNSFTNLGINTGTVTLGTNSAAGGFGIALNDNATLAAGVNGLVIRNTIVTTGNGLINTNGNSLTLAGNIAGPGSISNVGGGNLILNGNNSFINLGINTGTVTLGTSTAAGSGEIAINDNTTLAAGASNLVVTNRVVTTANGLVNTNGNSLTLAGTIAGPGSISNVGGGNLVLTGANTFRNLGINTGTVTLGTNSAAGIGSIALNDNATLAAGVAGLVIGNDIQTTGNGIVNSGPGVFTLSNQIGGAGSISQVGTGNLVLGGRNGFRNLGINQGTVTLGTNTAAGVGEIAINTNATLAAGSNNLVVANTVITTGNGLVNTNGTSFTLAGNVVGPGSISNVGGGNLVLTGVNSFTNLGINTGTVTLGSNSAAGIGSIALNNNAALAAGANNLVIANTVITTANGLINTNGNSFTLAGVVTGTGSISTVGGGNLVLNGANSFRNLGINTGTVTVGSNTAAGIGSIALDNNTTLAAGVSGLVLANDIQTTGNGIVDSGTGVFTLNGPIVGAGSISQVGTGNLVLNGPNSFRNLGINQGTVTVGSNTAAGIGSIAINNNATLAAGVSGLVLANDIQTTGAGTVNSGTGIFTLNGPIGGAGGITKTGAGVLVLGGANSFGGGLTIADGSVVQFGNSNGGGSGTITIADNGTLRNGTDLVLANNIVTLGNGLVDANGAGNSFTLNGMIGGAGSISNVGGGNLVLNGANSFTNLGINTGTVTLGTNTAAGIGSIAINNDATLAAGASNLVIANAVITTANGLVDTNGNNFTLAGPVVGTGSISNVGGGNLVLGGANGFNNLGINSGTVTLGTNTAAGIGSIALNNDATLAAGANNLVVANAVITTGNGLVNTNGGTFTLAGPVVGAGSISNVGGGNLVLNGANGFNNLGINTGTVTLGTNTAAGVGGIALNDNATLAAGTGQAGVGLVIANTVTTTGNGLVNTNGGVFTLSGVVAGPGSISNVGGGNLVLAGANSFRNLGINTGTVTLGTNSAAGVGDIALNNDATLAAGAGNLVIANTVITTGNGLVNANGTTFTLAGPVVGSGSISNVGGGNLVLAGANGFRNLGINTGTVTLGTSTAAGIGDIALNNNATLAAGASNLVVANAVITTGNGLVSTNGGIFTLAGPVVGAGSISNVGGGNLVLNGANGFRNLGINTGTVTLGTNSAAGIGDIALNNDATLAAGANNLVIANTVITTGNGLVNANGNTLTLTGPVAGAGSISNVGGGNLVLGGANSFRNLGINNGTVTVGSNTAAGSASIAINNGATLAAGVTGLTLANDIQTTGAGTINSGTGSFTLTNVISGGGSIVKTGSGVLNLTAASLYTGPTTIAAGRINLTGSIRTSAVTVASGGALAGTGTTGALTAASGSTITPGATAGAIATLSVNGALNLAAGSTFAVDVSGAGADRLSATGPATIAGNLLVTPVGNFTAFNQSYTIVSSSARTGTFATTSLGSFGGAFLPTVIYDATSVSIRLLPGSLVGAGGAGLGPNPLAVATAFDAAVAAGYNPQPFFALYTQGANLPTALSQLSGELHSAERRALLEDTRVVREAAFDRLNAGLTAIAGAQTVTTETDDSAFTFWLRGAGSWGTARNDGTGSRFTTEQTGVLTGIDYRYGDFKVGALFHYTRNDVDLFSLGKSEVESIGGGIYGGWRQDGGGFAAGIGGSYAGTNARGTRTITAPGLGQTLRSDIDGTTYQVFGEVAYDLLSAGDMRAEPFARIAYTEVKSDAFTETGGIAALVGAEQTNDLTLFTVGGRGAIDIDAFTLSASAGWQRTTGDRSGVTSSSITGLNSPATIRAVALDRDAASIDVQASYSITPRIKLGAGYSGLLGKNNSDHGARATLTVGF